jgi:hypothetical protein
MPESLLLQRRPRDGTPGELSAPAQDGPAPFPQTPFPYYRYAHAVPVRRV